MPVPPQGLEHRLTQGLKTAIPKIQEMTVLLIQAEHLDL